MTGHLPAPTGPKPVQKPRISKRLKRALGLWLTDRVSCRKDAAEKAGLTADYFCRALKRPHVRVVCREWAEQNINDATLRASSRVGELLDGASEHVASKVALRLLESDKLINPAGDTRGPVFNNFAPTGYIIDFRHDGDNRPLSEAQARDLAEQLESNKGAGGIVRPDPHVIDVTPEPEDAA